MFPAARKPTVSSNVIKDSKGDEIYWRLLRVELHRHVYDQEMTTRMSADIETQ